MALSTRRPTLAPRDFALILPLRLSGSVSLAATICLQLSCFYSTLRLPCSAFLDSTLRRSRLSRPALSLRALRCEPLAAPCLAASLVGCASRAATSWLRLSQLGRSGLSCSLSLASDMAHLSRSDTLRLSPPSRHIALPPSPPFPLLCSLYSHVTLAQLFDRVFDFSCTSRSDLTSPSSRTHERERRPMASRRGALVQALAVHGRVRRARLERLPVGRELVR
jgi:hypothetical protein